MLVCKGLPAILKVSSSPSDKLKRLATSASTDTGKVSVLAAAGKSGHQTPALRMLPSGRGSLQVRFNSRLSALSLAAESGTASAAALRSLIASFSLSFDACCKA